MLTGILPYAGAPRTNVQIQLRNSRTNAMGNGINSLANDAAPTTVDDYMRFSGGQAIRFADREEFHVTAPYSVELEVFLEVIDNKWIATSGEGFGAGWPEWSIAVSNSAIVFTSSNNNNGYTTTAPLVPRATIRQWYRVGFMFYLDGNGAYRVRGYVNDVRVFDIETTEPYNTPNGIAIGSDYTKYAQRFLNGRIRNVWIAKSLFWPI